MLKRLSTYWFLPLFLAIAGVVLVNTSLTGDGYEYMLTMHALFEHASPNITLADVDSLKQSAGGMPNYGATLADLMPLIHEHLLAPEKTPAYTYTIMPNDRGEFYGIHFGLYSLLALPFYALLKALGAHPYYAFSLLNLTFCAVACLYIRRAMPDRSSLAMLLFLLSGTTFYLSWTGPEVMTASCVVIAGLAILRGQTGLAILLAGLAASQNPPLFLLIPFAVAYRILMARYPKLQWPDSVASAVDKRELILAATGVLLALAPYAFFQWVFGTPSVIARDFNDPGFITGARLFSLFFDLNQGMVIGSPGIALALLLGLFLLPRQMRSAWLAVFVLVLGVVILMALPALSTINWNSGCVVMARYSYWLGMPLLAVALLAARLSSPKSAVALLLGGAVLQTILLFSTGLLGGKTIYYEHLQPARWVLSHFPQHYNPEAEIFHARTQKVVILPLPKDSISVFSANGKPTKIMRHQSNRKAPAGLCPAGSELQGENVRPVSREWEYLHAPFQCVARP
ncbi:hypothetical protein ACFFTM_17140 [Pseudoduganella plicata]|uniref:DUF2029 domain-containing protein n=1 Tax=Pseudoduganella plicata TaxID=321984 RepID=A0A4P7BCA5_9BURK|nr:hypothetical protein [Pseudoduganella plicata]QBQ35085.1 hypothetical protein E1742_02030 [Pseudoduganella plicata]GGZ10111.1 hypothetical protein GCM10007388_49520 [Pseudoduganella plicata]